MALSGTTRLTTTGQEIDPKRTLAQGAPRIITKHPPEGSHDAHVKSGIRTDALGMLIGISILSARQADV